MKALFGNKSYDFEFYSPFLELSIVVGDLRARDRCGPDTNGATDWRLTSELTADTATLSIVLSFDTEYQFRASHSRSVKITA